MKTALSLAVAALLGASPVFAQAPGVPIEDLSPLLQNGPLLEKAKVLREAGKLTLTIEKTKELLATPTPAALELPAVSTKPLDGRTVAERARTGYLRIGWYYLCPRCDHWHLNLAGGYAIARDAAATCHHCVQPGSDMREGYLIAVDHRNNVLPVTGILAKSQSLDAAILRIEGGDYTPLALNDNVAPGDPAYCLSEPLGQHGYFSQGIVNRFYWKQRAEGAEDSLDRLKQLRVNVSTDWAPGSSGAAVLDQCGNAIGHVSTISPMREGQRRQGQTDRPTTEEPSKNPPATAEADKKAPESKDGEKKAPAPKSDAPKPERGRGDRFDGATLITLHEAVPARSIRALIAAQPAVIPPPTNSTEAKPAAPPSREGRKKEPIDARMDHDHRHGVYPAPVALPTAEAPAAAPAAPATPPPAAAAPGTAAQPAQTANSFKVAATAPAPVPVTLSIGSPAPALETGNWVQGEPVKEFSRDKVYLVEFWATWCGPCRTTIPHLNEIHQKYQEKGLVVIGQDCLEQDRAKVAPFVQQMGDKMTYRVAFDTPSEKPDGGAMYQKWMKAAGQGGIPTAFLVDKTGTIAWIGHPMTLKEADIEAVLAGKFDVAKAKLEFEENTTARKLVSAQAPEIMKAIRAQKWEDAEAAIAKLDGELPASRKQATDDFHLQIALARKDGAAAKTVAERIVGRPDVNPLIHVRLALILSSSPGLENFDWAFAEKLAEKGLAAVPADQRSLALDTLARIQFKQGKKDQAIKTQEEAIAAAPETARKRLQTTLDTYKSGSTTESTPKAATPTAPAAPITPAAP